MGRYVNFELLIQTNGKSKTSQKSNLIYYYSVSHSVASLYFNLLIGICKAIQISRQHFVLLRGLCKLENVGNHAILACNSIRHEI